MFTVWVALLAFSFSWGCSEVPLDWNRNAIERELFSTWLEGKDVKVSYEDRGSVINLKI